MPHSVAELQAGNVCLELECIDRMYLNCYVGELDGHCAAAENDQGFRQFGQLECVVADSPRYRRQGWLRRIAC